MVNLNPCGLHLLVRITLLSLLLPPCSSIVPVRRTEINPVRDAVDSKIREHFHKLRDRRRIDVDYGEDDAGPSSSRRRDLSSRDSFSKIRIQFETTQIERQILESALPNAEARGKLLIDTILPTVGARWSSALRVIPARPFTLPGEAGCIVDFPVPPGWNDGEVGVSSADLVVFVGAYDNLLGETICGEGLGVLAFASVCLLDTYDRPVVGFVNVCLNAIQVGDDGSAREKDVAFTEEVVLHEVGHALGLTSDFISYFRNPVTDVRSVPDPYKPGCPRCVDGTRKHRQGVPPPNILRYGKDPVHSAPYYEMVTPTVRQVVRNRFACQDVTGARLENQPTSGDDCYGSHLDERFFLSDLMSAYYDPAAGFFSPVALAFLEDSGHYRANYDTAQNSPFGLGAGCNFATGSCIVDDKVPEYARGFFCDDVSPDDNLWQCDASHQFRGRCDLQSLYKPPKVSYFKDRRVGPAMFQSADYCPVILPSDDRRCDEQRGQSKVNEYEVFGSRSRCIDFSSADDFSAKSAMCARAACNAEERSFDVHLGDDTYSCREDFQELNTTTAVMIRCPRLTAACPDMFCPSMCSGKGICDWSLPAPACRCFDPEDATPNCNDSDPVAPDAYSSSDRRRIVSSLFLLQLVFLASYYPIW